MKRQATAFALMAAFGVAACSDSPLQPDVSTIQLTVSTQASALAPSAALRGTFGARPPTVDGNTVTFGADEIIIDRAEIVLREIELERAESAGCESDEETAGDDDDDCEEFETGPILLDLPFTDGGEVAVSIEVEPGTFDELEFEVHKPEDSGDDADLEFLALHPDFIDVSIRVSGSWNGNDFVYETDLNTEQEIDLVPPLVVADTEIRELVLLVDVGAWFVNQTNDGLVNPATANKGQPNENLVRDNIDDSFESFESDDADDD